ncbi:MAG: desulfoferrodoxin family protein [Eubacteriaceae bacterium]
MAQFYKTEKNVFSVPDGEKAEGKELKAGSSDGAKEKHVPVINKEGNKVTVKVGEVPHPMTPEHWIEMIELFTDKGSYRKNLTPDDKPEAVFILDEGEAPVEAFEFCNLHGLFKKEA